MARLVQFAQHGDADRLKVVERPIRHPEAGEVLIEVKAFGIQRADILWREGQYIQSPEQFPVGLGYDCVGIISAVGEEVSPWQIGDPVSVLPGFSLNRYTVYGDAAIIHQDCLIPLPKVDLTWAEYAAIAVPYFTAYFPLFEVTNLPQAKFIVVTAAACSVGIAAMQMAKAHGVTVIGTSRTYAKRDRILDLGADYFIATETNDVVDQIRAIVGNHGVDIVFDPIGGAMIGKWYQIMKRQGHIIHYGLLDLTDATIPMMPAMFNSVKLNTFMIFEYTGNQVMGMERNPDAIARAVSYINSGFETGEFTPIIAKSFLLDEVSDAHRYLESNKQIGKIVVTT